MAERDQVEHDDAADDEAEEEPSRDFPIGPTARFTIGGKPLVLDDFIDITTGDLSNRPHAQPVEQPPAMPKAVIWNARRPLDD